MDAADNVGGPPCEVALSLPAPSCDTDFAHPKGTDPEKRPRPPRKAVCAKPGAKVGEWVSGIDGVVFR